MDTSQKPHFIEDKPNAFLADDFSRCMGKDCEVREQCLRYTRLSDIGYKTPVTVKMCS